MKPFVHGCKKVSFVLIRQVLGCCENTIIPDDQNQFHLIENIIKTIGVKAKKHED